MEQNKLPTKLPSEYVPLLNNDFMQQYKLSLESASNLSCNALGNQMFHKNMELLNENSVKHILVSSFDLTTQNTDIVNIMSWKSSISNFTDPIQLFDKSAASCMKCQFSENYHGMQEFLRNDCKCNIDNETMEVDDEQKLAKPEFGEETSNKDIDLKDDSMPNTSKDPNDNKPLDDKPNINKEPDIDKEEEKNSAHKSSVAKVTFKTAKEQLLASNPSAKRTLGTSRKAQSKFVSPMLGVVEQGKQVATEATVTDEKLKNIDPKMVELIESEIIDKGTPVGWEDIAGLQMAKSVIQEAVVWPLLRPDIFTGLRRPPKGILLFGPPGTGKTLIGRCVAAQCRATFFSISASSLTSKWIGDGEKMVRALFAVARCHQPAVIFIDEIDSLLTQRSDAEHEATRRIKTEFLVQFDGAATAEDDRLLIIGATNRPQELDEAARRRLVKRLYIPLPDIDARVQIITNLLQREHNDLSQENIAEVAKLTEGYSGADMRSLCSEAAMGPIRSVPLSQIITIDRENVRPVQLEDFTAALQRVRPSVSQDDLSHYVKWNNTYGHGF